MNHKYYLLVTAPSRVTFRV